jgi:hypothetical protein
MEANGVQLYARSRLVEYLFNRSGNVFLGSQATVGVADVRLQSKASFYQRSLLRAAIYLQSELVCKILVSYYVSVTPRDGLHVQDFSVYECKA